MPALRVFARFHMNRQEGPQVGLLQTAHSWANGLMHIVWGVHMRRGVAPVQK